MMDVMPEFTLTHATEPHGARVGILHTTHGDIPTPNFMPVATRGVFHGLEFSDAKTAGVDVIMCNTYHLSREIGAEKIAAAGGLHKWTGWDKPIATDSGGFQVFSYGWSRTHGVMKKSGGINAPNVQPTGQSQVAIDDDGVTFRDGEKTIRLTPAESMRLQQLLGADIAFAFDEPTSPLHDEGYTRQSLERTHRWAKLCLDHHHRSDQMLLGIVQGGPFQSLREISAKAIGSLPFGGFAIGGSYEAGGMAKALRWAVPFLPSDRVRHVLGIGWVRDIIEAVDAGADLFDCVEPIRRARHQSLLVGDRYEDVTIVARRQGNGPLVNDCDCVACEQWSAQQIKAWCKARDFQGSRALAIHNVRTMVRLMADIRHAITEGRWPDYTSRLRNPQ